MKQRGKSLPFVQATQSQESRSFDFKISGLKKQNKTKSSEVHWTGWLGRQQKPKEIKKKKCIPDHK